MKGRGEGGFVGVGSDPTVKVGLSAQQKGSPEEEQEGGEEGQGGVHKERASIGRGAGTEAGAEAAVEAAAATVAEGAAAAAAADVEPPCVDAGADATAGVAAAGALDAAALQRIEQGVEDLCRHRELSEASLQGTGLQQWQLLELLSEELMQDLLQKAAEEVGQVLEAEAERLFMEA